MSTAFEINRDEANASIPSQTSANAPPSDRVEGETHYPCEIPSAEKTHRAEQYRWRLIALMTGFAQRRMFEQRGCDVAAELRKANEWLYRTSVEFMTAEQIYEMLSQLQVLYSRDFVALIDEPEVPEIEHEPSLQQLMLSLRQGVNRIFLPASLSASMAQMPANAPVARPVMRMMPTHAVFPCVVRHEEESIIDTTRRRIEELRRLFVFRNQSNVTSYLEKNESCISLLLEIPSKVRRVFGEVERLILDVRHERSGSPQETLFAYIVTNKNVDEAWDLMRKIEEEWWLKAVSDERVNLHVEFTNV